MPPRKRAESVGNSGRSTARASAVAVAGRVAGSSTPTKKPASSASTSASLGKRKRAAGKDDADGTPSKPESSRARGRPRSRAAATTGVDSPDDAEGSREPLHMNAKRRRTSVSRSRTGTPSRASSIVPRASTMGPTTGAAAYARVLAALKARPDVVLPAPHERPARMLWVWGNAWMGQLGLGVDHREDVSSPLCHPGIHELSKMGKLGDTSAGLEAAVAGGLHSLCIDEQGQIWSWGINDHASLGRPTSDIPDPVDFSKTIDPEILETTPGLVQALNDEEFRAVKVAAGVSVSVALGLKGELRVWGTFRSADGLLGVDARPNASDVQLRPIPMASLQQHEFIDIVCGSDHVLALSKAGFVYAWGNGQQAQLGRKIIERRKTAGLDPERLAVKNVVRIGSGSYHSFAVDRDGIVYAWGLNNLSQTGIPTSELIISKPTPVLSLSPSSLAGRRVVQITGGESHSLFLLSDGSVRGCGRCDGYELGLADDHPALLPGGEVDERRQRREERWWAKKKIAEEKKEKAEETKRKRRASSVGRAAAVNAVPPTIRIETANSQEDDTLTPTQSQHPYSAISQSQSSEFAIEMALTHPRLLSRTPSAVQTPATPTGPPPPFGELAADKPPIMNDYVAEPVPIPFPTPPKPSSRTQSHPRWSKSAYTSRPSDPVVEIASGPRYNLALTKAGHLYAWGYSTNCALGLGTGVESAQVPTRVSLGDGQWTIDSISAGGMHCLVTARSAGPS